MTEADKWMARYAADHGYEAEHEPDLGISRRPDFLLTRGGLQVVCEVKAFETSGLERRAAVSPMFSASDEDMYGDVRAQVHAAARQMRELQGREIPLVAVLANPAAVMLETSPPSIGYAMYGNPTFGGPMDPARGVITSMGPVQGRDGELTNDHPYLSAVAMLRRREQAADARDQWLDENREWFSQIADQTDRSVAMAEGILSLDVPEGDYLYLDVIHTTAARLGHAPLVHETLFDGPHDRHWVIERDGTCQPADRSSR